MNRLKNFFPFIGWFANYNGRLLSADFLAGISVGLVLIPQSMANAQLAGLPAHYGLYASFIPTIISALFSSSRNMCTGMVGIIAMMTAAALTPLAATGSDGYIAYAVLLSLLVGAIQISLRLFRLSYLVSFLSQPVIAGFSNASVILIAISQFGKFFGVNVEPGNTYLETFYRVLSAALQDTHLPTLGLALLALLIIKLLPRFSPRIPAILLAVVTTTLLAWAFDFEDKRIIDADHIRSENASAIFTELRSDLAELQALQSERDAAHLQLKSIGEKSFNTILELQYQQDSLDAELANLRSQLGLNRSRLRNLRLVESPEQPGTFIERNSPALSTTDGSNPKIWKLSVPASGQDFSKVTISSGGDVVGHIPAGFPGLSLPYMEAATLLDLLPFALAIAFIGLANGMAVAKTNARESGDYIDAKQEVLAQGLANIASGLSHSGPVSGSFSSSGVSARSGGSTGMTAVFAGLTPLLAMLFFTPMLYYLPLSVLAAIVISSMMTQLRFTMFKHNWLVHWTDGFIGIATFVVTLASAPRIDIGLMIGVGLSMAVFLYSSMHPGIVSLSINNDGKMCDSSVLKDQQKCEYLAVLRFQRSLSFMNSSVLEEYIHELVKRKPLLRHIHLVCTGINEIDASGKETLSLLVRWAHKSGIGTSMNGLNERVRAVLERSGLIDEIGRENIYDTLRDAVCSYHSRLPEAQSDTHHCHWQSFCEKTEAHNCTITDCYNKHKKL
ncbi:STAS domain-containing protein [Desulfovibrio sp. OttesenSCG-928-C06]|nr:STAS domain-containing protein [Desulfovibrio sp. OttesenSCG-928-C06]